MKVLVLTIIKLSQLIIHMGTYFFEPTYTLCNILL